MTFALRRSPRAKSSVNRGCAAMLIAMLPSWPTTRNRVAAVYTAAQPGPSMIATSTMSIRWSVIFARLAIPRGEVGRDVRHPPRALGGPPPDPAYPEPGDGRGGHVRQRPQRCEERGAARDRGDDDAKHL